MSYKIKFIDSARFMASPLSNFIDNLAEGSHKIKLFFEHEGANDNLISHNYLCCNKSYSYKIDEELKLGTYSY